MEMFWADLRYALRRLRRSPWFVLATVLSLGLGIGANTAIFSLLNALMLRPLPVQDPQRLVRFGSIDSHGFIGAVPGPMFDWLRSDPLFEGVCGVNTPLTTIEVRDVPLAVGGQALSGGCYEMLGVRPTLGRLFGHQDDVPTAANVVVLGYSFWQSQFGGDPKVLGQTIRVDGSPFTIIGVTEPRFQGFLLGYPPGVYFPITQAVSPTRADSLAARTFYWGFAFARLKPGVIYDQVKAQLQVDWRRRLDESLPARIQGRQRAEALAEPLVVTSGSTGLDYSLRNRFRRPLVALLVISALVLLVACLNVANLLLARGFNRRREIAVRLALGARRWLVVRELLAESAVLIVAGVGGALLLAQAGDRVLLGIFVETLRHLRDDSLGFQTEGVLTVQLMPLPGGYAHGFTPAPFYHALLERLQNLPGVEAASFSHFSPLFTVPYNEEIRPALTPDAAPVQAPAEYVSHGFLGALRIPLLQGHDFERTDSPQSPKTAVVSESLAKRLYPGGAALGITSAWVPRAIRKTWRSLVSRRMPE